MLELHFDNRIEHFDDNNSRSIHAGTKAVIYPYKNFECLKVSDYRREIYLKEGTIRIINEIMNFNRDDIYKVREFFKIYYEYDEKVLRNCGYTADYVAHYHNDLTHNGRPCFNILTVPMEQFKKYWYQMFELMNFLTSKRIEVNDLHRRNVVKGIDKFTLIDCDEYCRSSVEKCELHNYEELRHLFADLITAGLYFTFDVGTDEQYNQNYFADLYQKYVKKDLLTYNDFDIDTVMDFLKNLEGYNNLEEYFQDRNPSFVNRKILIK